MWLVLICIDEQQVCVRTILEPHADASRSVPHSEQARFRDKQMQWYMHADEHVKLSAPGVNQLL